MLLSRDSSLARWPERRARPIRVWIQPSSDGPDWTASYVDDVHAAFDEWDALDLSVSFTYVADSIDAGVHVTWVNSFQEGITGHTTWTRNNHWWITDASRTRRAPPQGRRTRRGRDAGDSAARGRPPARARPHDRRAQHHGAQSARRSTPAPSYERSMAAPTDGI
jgi:hypothetical protein